MSKTKTAKRRGKVKYQSAYNVPTKRNEVKNPMKGQCRRGNLTTEQRKINSPLQPMDVVYGIMMFIIMYPRRVANEYDNEVSDDFSVLLNGLCMFVITGIAALYVNWRLKGFVNKLIMFMTAICLLLGCIWLIAGFLEYYELGHQEHGINLQDCHIPGYITVPKNGVICCASFILVLFISSSFY
ncbi:uncharacterized protein LOC120338084 [Styela clava]